MDYENQSNMSKQSVNTDLSSVNRQRFRAFRKFAGQRTRTPKNCQNMYGRKSQRVETFFLTVFLDFFFVYVFRRLQNFVGVCDMRVAGCVCDKRVVMRGLETRVMSVTVLLTSSTKTSLLIVTFSVYASLTK